MHPVIFDLGSLSVPSHEFFIALGIGVAALWFVHETRVQGVHDRRIWWIVFGALLTGGIFSRFSAFVHWAEDPGRGTVADLFVYGGRSILGGLAGAYAGVLITKRIVGYRASTGDLFAPAIALGMAIGRIGCFLTEPIGTPTSLPWGITVAPDIGAQIPACPQCALGVPLHPSYLYEIVFQLVMFGVLVYLRRRPLGHWRRPGDLFKLYLVCYGLFRFSVEFVRGDRELWLGLSGPQVFLLVTLPLLFARFGRDLLQRRRPPALGVAVP